MTLSEAKQRIQAIINMAGKRGNNLGELVCEADSVLEYLAQHEYEKGEASHRTSYQDGHNDGYEKSYQEAKELSREEKI